MELTENEQKVLEFFNEDIYPDGELCAFFSHIERKTNLPRKQIQMACKSLCEKELVEFFRGLMTEDGEVAGSGYCISRKGAAFLNPCDVCGNEITYDYQEDDKGIGGWQAGFNKETSRRIRLCETHYQAQKQSAHN